VRPKPSLTHGHAPLPCFALRLRLSCILLWLALPRPRLYNCQGPWTSALPSLPLPNESHVPGPASVMHVASDCSSVPVLRGSAPPPADDSVAVVIFCPLSLATKQHLSHRLPLLHARLLRCALPTRPRRRAPRVRPQFDQVRRRLVHLPLPYQGMKRRRQPSSRHLRRQRINTWKSVLARRPPRCPMPSSTSG